MGRTLIYIPIIHTDPDLGSLANDIEEKTSRVLGEYWQEHKKTVEDYWREIIAYFERKSVKGMKIFQDGLPVGSKAGQSIVNKLAQTGSPNYHLLKELVNRGAVLCKTEDPNLLHQEYQLTKALLTKKPFLAAIVAFLNYRLKKGTLLKARDSYIAKRIRRELKEGETGICFLGAYHKILSELAKDIRIVLFKHPKKVKEYYHKLSSGGAREGKLNDLARYLTKPVKQGLIITNGEAQNKKSAVRDDKNKLYFQLSQ